MVEKKKWFKQAVVNKNDEYYTTKEHVENIFQKYLNNYNFKNKVVYCPCDSDKSEFVKYLKENELSLGYKELIYTCDDFRTHEDLFYKSDIIITNPPFSLLIKYFLPLLNKCGKDFFVFGPEISMGVIYNINNRWRLILPVDRDLSIIYNTQDPEVKKFVSIVYVTNISSIPFYNKKLVINENNLETDVYDIKTGYKVYDRLSKIPYTKEKIFVPITVILEQNKYLFEIEGFDSLDERVENRCSDGRQRYLRVLCKLK